MHTPSRDLVWTPPALLVAASIPSLLAFNEAPSATFLNQALAFLSWGLVAAAVGWECRAGRAQGRQRWLSTAPVAAVLALLVICAVASHLYGSLPAPLFLSALGTLGAAGLLLLAGAHAAAAPGALAQRAFAWACAALLTGALLNAGVALVQSFVPEWADGQWIARSSLVGRAVGNLRQPNHVCSLLLWGILGAVGLIETGRLRRGWAMPALALLALALVLTASRTAVVVAAAMAAWGLLDRRLSADGRRALVVVPALYALAWLAMAAWSRWAHAAFGGEQRLAEADLSASRFRIWSDTLQLIAQHPWTGVGFGEFNFAWSLSVLPQRPVAFFDHSHNLLLQWAVEQGLPMAALLSGLLLLGLWRVVRACRRTDAGPRSTALRLSLAVLLVMAWHSQLEYPLWYAYFLLPTAWWFGFALQLARPADDARDGHGDDVPEPAWRLVAAGLVLAFGTVASVGDYARVVRVFDAQSEVPLAQRIVHGQGSWFFAHHADYAAATVSSTPERELDALRRASHFLIDTRLMTAWAEGLAAAGDLPRARYLAERLREFRNPNSATFFGACAPAASAPSPARAAPAPGTSSASAGTSGDSPFQCQGPDPRVVLGWRDFR